MAEDDQTDLLSSFKEIDLVRFLIADLHDDLAGKVARFHQLSDLSTVLGSNGTLMPGGHTTYIAWSEARTSFVHGNYIATVMLCQGLAEHLLASHLALGIDAERLPDKIPFQDTLRRCLADQVISQEDANDLRRLMTLRNPLSHYRNINDPTNLSRRALDTRSSVEDHLKGDASFAISVAIRLLALPAFRLDG
jgi:hypothetical protein